MEHQGTHLLESKMARNAGVIIFPDGLQVNRETTENVTSPVSTTQPTIAEAQLESSFTPPSALGDATWLEGVGKEKLFWSQSSFQFKTAGCFGCEMIKKYIRIPSI
ncbi:hypothetical protein CPB83DRAFT_114028 [Crepidotus variabilis]|uniref:Uncharacterized protein n=1 Tax=Crepidotus variabilis TaxID=179855 RepID=A0A9P6E4I7_9AGAR|nr:hypothetical protein CPB83DRAFT_114028 [Crepidotus variabilis]